MFFSREDILKILKALTELSIKDSEMPEAYTPFNIDDTISIVQKGYNKKISVKEFIDLLQYIKKEDDFVNITDTYDESFITLEEAILLIPEVKRKKGLVITFQDTDGNWQMYQFRGELNQWNVTGAWKDLYDFEEYIVNSVLPDEEDLTKVLVDSKGNYASKLKDRAYDPENFSGLGRIILRKNIVEIEDPEYGKVKKNILYQDMFTQSGTVYEIRYDFDLNGAEITIPKNSILLYSGGSLNNGVIIYDNTSIEGKERINNVVTKGVYIDKRDSIYDTTNFSGLGKKYLIKNIVNGKNILTQDMIDKENTIYIILYDFTLGEDITIPTNCVLEFDGGSISGNGAGKDTITGNNTGINAGLVKIFDTDIFFDGIWKLLSIPVQWFYNNNGTDAGSAFQKAIDFSNKCIGSKVDITGSFTISSVVSVRGALNLEGHWNPIVLNGETHSSVSTNPVSEILFTNGASFNILGNDSLPENRAKDGWIFIKNILFQGNGNSNCINFYAGGFPSSISEIKNCSFSNFLKALNFVGLRQTYGTFLNNFTIQDNYFKSDNQYAIYAHWEYDNETSGHDDPSSPNYAPDYGQKPTFSNSRIINNVFDSKVLIHGFYGHNTFSDNTMQSLTGTFLDISIYVGHLDMIGNYFEGNGDAANKAYVYISGGNSRAYTKAGSAHNSSVTLTNFSNYNNNSNQYYKFENVYIKNLDYCILDSNIEFVSCTFNYSLLLQPHIGRMLSSDNIKANNSGIKVYYIIDYLENGLLVSKQNEKYVATSYGTMQQAVFSLKNNIKGNAITNSQGEYTIPNDSSVTYPILYQGNNILSFYKANGQAVVKLKDSDGNVKHQFQIDNHGEGLCCIMFESIETLYNFQVSIIAVESSLYFSNMTVVNLSTQNTYGKYVLADYSVLIDPFSNITSTLSNLPNVFTNTKEAGKQVFVTTINKPVVYDGDLCREFDGAVADTTRFGYYDERPSANKIYEGFRFFCRDKKIDTNPSSPSFMQIITDSHVPIGGIVLTCQHIDRTSPDSTNWVATWVDIFGRTVS